MNQSPLPSVSQYRFLLVPDYWILASFFEFDCGEYMYIQGWFMSMYDKNHYNIIKWLASN